MERLLIPEPPTSRGSFVLSGNADVTRLPKVLDLTAAMPLRDCLQALPGLPAAAVDASAVERMSTRWAQVLLAAGGAGGGSFRIPDPSDGYRAARGPDAKGVSPTMAGCPMARTTRVKPGDDCADRVRASRR